MLPPPFENRAARNVSRPTLTAFLPDPAVATGTAVIVCPGGAFHFLSMDSEGVDAARWLASRGVAAFVLKYRLIPTPEPLEDFMAQVERAFTDREWMRGMSHRHATLAIADGRQAMTVVRQRAAEWGISPDRIGILGFSAGGRVTAGVSLEHDESSRPDFAAAIYGALWEDLAVPADAPPLFVAVANNDELAADHCVDLFSAWRSAGHPDELHVFADGGHGFGMKEQGLPSDRWIDLFGEWLRAQGLLDPTIAETGVGGAPAETRGVHRGL